ncbi:MAG: hypothetical protein ACRDZQ_17175, partial [Acidimicrobiales bacterium]
MPRWDEEAEVAVVGAGWPDCPPLSTSPEPARVLDLADLDLHPFVPGALVYGAGPARALRPPRRTVPAAIPVRGVPGGRAHHVGSVLPPGLALLRAGGSACRARAWGPSRPSWPAGWARRG